MKKLLLGVLLFTLTISTFAFDGYLRVGTVSPAKSYNSEEKSFEHYAPTIGGEITQSFIFADLGAGIAYNGKTSGTDISTVPVYLVARWTPLPILVKPYLTVKYGTVLETYDNVSHSKPEGKQYYGVGLGVNFSSLQAEILYSKTEIDHDKRGNDDLEQVSLVVGYQLF